MDFPLPTDGINIQASIVQHLHSQPYSNIWKRTIPTFANPSYMAAVCNKPQHLCRNKKGSQVYSLSWMAQSKFFLSGYQSGQIVRWNVLNFKYDGATQLHNKGIRTMRWSKDSNILLSASDEGVIKIWSSSLRPLCDPVLVHEEAVREVSLSPGDTPSKFVSCSDDKTAIIWDLDHFTYECILKGHGWNVNSCDWHPYMALIATGSRDSKIKLWDPREGRETYTIHNHKQQVSKVRWSLDGNMILSGSKDTSCKLHDVRTMNEFQTFKSHEKDVSCIAWHPTHPNIFVSGGQDGSMAYWAVGQNLPISFDPNAHDLVIHDLLWHPMGHILASGSEDQVVKIWYSDITA